MHKQPPWEVMILLKGGLIIETKTSMKYRIRGPIIKKVNYELHYQSYSQRSTYGEVVHSKAIQGRPFSISHDCFQRIELGNVIHSPLSSTPMMI